MQYQMRKIGFGGLCVCIAGVVNAWAGSRCYVDANATGSVHDGSSWCQAFMELHEALAAAQSDPNISEILVADGTYRPTHDDPNSSLRLATFQLLDGVAIQGGYAGCGASDPNQRDLNLYETILSGDLNGDDDPNWTTTDDFGAFNRSENAFSVVTGSGTDATAVLDGFTITGGNSDETIISGVHDSHGGGLFNKNGNPTIQNCIFVKNTAEGGGAIYNSNSAPSIKHCLITGNSALEYGGGIGSQSSDTVLVDCTISENKANDYGGGYYDRSGSSSLTGCQFNANVAGYDGGGMYTEYCNLTLDECRFLGNSAGDFGGGNYNSFDSQLEFNNCEFIENIAGFDGGAIYNSRDASLTMQNSHFRRNSAKWDGGGIYNSDEVNLAITNCLFSGNSAHAGGGMFNGNRSAPVVTNVAFVGNTANAGGAICIDEVPMTLENCIIWGNEANLGPQIYDSSGELTTSYCCVQGGWPGLGNIDSDPLFVDAAGPDGVVGSEDDDLHLASGSPCIDAGDNDAIPLGVFTDIAGFPRRIDDPLVMDSGFGAAPIVDMGAYEAGGEVLGQGSDCNLNGVLDAFDIAGGFSTDLDENGLPDECTPAFNITQVTGHLTIQDAIDQAIDGDVIEVASGTYVGHLLLDKTIALRSIHGPQRTILDGGAMGRVVTIDNNAGDGTLIDGFALRNGRMLSGRPAMGGALMINGCNPTVRNCIISGSTSRYGGGLSITYGNPTLINCIIAGNEAQYGGGINTINAQPTLINCTIAANHADDQAGGIFNASNSLATLINCIAWSDTSADSFEIVNDATSSALVTYSCVQGGWSGTGNIDANPLFVDPNGMDGVPGTHDDNLRLGVGSACIDAGTTVAVGLDDIDHHYRVYDDPNAPNTGDLSFPIDMGAYEFQAPRIGDLDFDNDSDINDYMIMQLFFTQQNIDADLDRDNDIDGDDFILLQQWIEGPLP